MDKANKYRVGFVILTYSEKKHGKINPNRVEQPDSSYIVMMLRQYGDLGFIGGKTDPEDETMLDGVIRELEEEVGLLNTERGRFEEFKTIDTEDSQIYTYRYDLSRNELKRILTNQYNPLESLEAKEENNNSQIAFENFGLLIVPINKYLAIKEGLPMKNFLKHTFPGSVKEDFLEMVKILVEEFDNEKVNENYNVFIEKR